MIGIICAREEEIRDFLEKTTQQQVRSVGGFTFVQGLLMDKRVV